MAVPAIDTHDHLPPFDKLPGYVETEQGKGMKPERTAAVTGDHVAEVFALGW